MNEIKKQKTNFYCNRGGNNGGLDVLVPVTTAHHGVLIPQKRAK